MIEGASIVILGACLGGFIFLGGMFLGAWISDREQREPRPWWL